MEHILRIGEKRLTEIILDYSGGVLMYKKTKRKMEK
jgi:hypothetical protein